MFEDSLFASGVSSDKRRSARRTRYVALTSIGLQGLLLAACLTVPLLWPETLPLISVAPEMALLSKTKPVVKVEPKVMRTSKSIDTAVHAPTSAPALAARIGGSIAHGPATVQAADGPSLYAGSNIGGPASLASILNGSNSNAPTVVTAAPKKSEPFAVS